METHKYFFMSSSGYFTIEQSFEKIDPKQYSMQFFLDHGVEYNKNGHWIYKIWSSSMCEGINTRLTWDESIKVLKDIVNKRSTDRKYLILTSMCTIREKKYEYPLKIDLN